MQKNKDDIAKKNFRIHLLIRKFSLLWAIFVIAGCVANSSGYEVHGRYVHYDCSPVVGENMVMRGSSPGIAGYSFSGAQGITDAEGDFSGVVSGSSGLIIIPGHELERNWGGGKETRFFDRNELNQLRLEMSREMPILIYRDPYLPRNDLTRTRLNQTLLFPVPEGNVRENARWYEFPGSVSSREGKRAHLKIGFERTKKAAGVSWQATFSGINGGLIAVPADKLPFLETLPVEGYDQTITIKFDKKDVGGLPIKKAFYLSADNGRAFATVIMNLQLVSHEIAVANRLTGGDSPFYLVGNMFVDILFVDKFSRSRPAITSPYLQQRKCGGAMAYDHNSFYAKAVDLPLKPTAQLIAIGNRLKNKYAAYDLAEKAKQPTTSIDWLLKPEHLHNHWIAIEMLKRGDLDDQVANAMLEYYRSGDTTATNGYQVLQAMSAANSLSPNLYHKLANISSGHIFTLVRNKSLPQSLLKDMVEGYMSRKKTNPVLRALAANPALSEESVDMLAASKDKRVLYFAANHKNASPELLTKLSQHSDIQIKKEVAWNLHTPSNVLQRMSEMGSEEINHNIATNPNTPSSVLVALAKSSNRNLHYVIGCNPNTPAALRKRLFDLYYGSNFIRPIGECWRKERQRLWKR